MPLPIGFFAPFPLALMLPFMAAQSMIMGDSFGKAYQYGKRKISAMSNEDFNKLDTRQLGQEILTDYRNIIPSVTQAIEESNKFQSLIVNQLAQILRDLPADLVGGITGNQELADRLKANTESNVKGTGDIIINIMNAINSALPGIPDAEARLVTAELVKTIDTNQDPNKFLPPTPEHIKRVAEQKLQTAQNIRDQRIIEAKKRAEERKIQRAVAPAAHIIDRSRSNVSMQSLILERRKLLQAVSTALSKIKQEQAAKGRPIQVKNQRVASAFAGARSARQRLANFMKMHGARF